MQAWSIIGKIEQGKLSGDKAKGLVDKSVSQVDITIDEAVKSIIEEATAQKDSTTEPDENKGKSITDIFDSIELPRF